MSHGSPFKSAIAAAALAPFLAAPLAAVAGAAKQLMPEPPKMPSAQPQMTTETQLATDTAAAAQAQAMALQRRRGMASTILTGPLGITSQPQTQRATLGA